jgi:hypothetical protein
MGMKYVSPELYQFAVSDGNLEAVFAAMREAKEKLAEQERAYRRHLSRIRKHLPVRFRQWLSRHIYLHDAVVHGPTEQLETVWKCLQWRGMHLDGDQDDIRVHFQLRLLMENARASQDRKNLFIEATHPGQAFVLLCYLGVVGYEVSRWEAMDPDQADGEKLWLYDEVDITQHNDRRLPVHRILFSDGTISEITFQDFRCFEARLL